MCVNQNVNMDYFYIKQEYNMRINISVYLLNIFDNYWNNKNNNNNVSEGPRVPPTLPSYLICSKLFLTKGWVTLTARVTSWIHLPP